jgi:Phage tail tube, TTP, lambda-like
MSIKTQGSKLYCIDPDTHAVLGVECMTQFNPGGAPADQLEDTCMEDTGGTRTYKPGLRTPGQASVEIKPDPANESHVRMFELSQGDVKNLDWALGWSDGTEDPTADSNGFDLPATRTWLTFNGYIADFPFNFALNTLVEGTISIQRSGALAWVVKT